MNSVASTIAEKPGLQANALDTTAMKRAVDHDQKRKNAIKGAFFSEFIDMFDIYLPVVILAPVMFLFQAPNLDGGMQAILASLVFITTLLGRPVGAFLFGRIADRLGRRRASIWSVAGFGVVTFLIACLPTYGQIGVSAYWLLVILRFVDGIFLGGGYTGSIPLAMEYSRKEQRGLVGGIIIAGFPAAYLCINLTALAMFALFPLNGPDSPYAQWGWRIPFILGGVLAGLLALYYVRNVSESEVWTDDVKVDGAPIGAIKKPKAPAPRASVFSGAGARSMLQVLLMMTGFWLTQNIITIYLPAGVLVQGLKLTGSQMSLVLLTTYTVLCFSYIGSGLLAQRIGRRRFFMIAGPLISVVGSSLLYLLTQSKGSSLPVIGLLVCSLAVLVTSPWGVILTYINERFTTDVRATGFGVGLSLSVILPSFYAFYMNGLAQFMPRELTPVVLLCLGGLIGAIGAAWGPETRDVDF